MKIARYIKDAAPQIGIIKGHRIVSLKTLGVAIDDMIDLINGGPSVLQDIEQRAANTDEGDDLSSVRLLAPLRPGKMLCIGMNYRRHADEARKLGINVPDNQLWFNKQTSCVSGPYDAIEPGVTEKLDYEVELGAVIGKAAKGVSRKHALDHVFGYIVGNDVSARDWQMHSPTMTMGKSFDTHGPIGPWIVTADEVIDPHSLGLRCFVNGEKRQDSNTSDLIYPIDEQIEYLSTAFTLEPGDILLTGTPEGVGIAMDPPQFLKAGDVVRCEIDKIGAIENTVAG
ncbi:MAG: fumarylacetoacetate hydrolase family protein [Novosphingobium sp.]|nr:fumarylacetoacetate hydrolase family protein [Novosphingobium sp.]